MELVQSRIVTDDVEGLAAFYARLIGTPVALNEYYVEVQAGQMSVGFSKCRFTEYGEDKAVRPDGRQRRDEIILDFLVEDVDAEYERIDILDRKSRMISSRRCLPSVFSRREGAPG